MNNDELEKYLNSLILCQEYYYCELMVPFLFKFNDNSNFHSEKGIIDQKSLRYYYNNQCPNGIPYDFSLVEKSLALLRSDTYTYIKGVTKHTYSRKEAIDYFINNLKKTLDEYLKKSNLEFIDLFLIQTDPSCGYGFGSIVIHTLTETFVLRAYDGGEYGRHR